MIESPQYVSGEYPFPNTDINPELKTENYCRRWAQAIYSLWCKNETEWGVESVNRFRENRAYAQAQQDTMQYQSFLKSKLSSDDEILLWSDNSFTKEAKRKGYYNLMFENISPAPKILSAFHGMLDKADYDILVDMVDAESRGLVEYFKYKKFFEARDREFQVEFKTKAGLPIDEEVNFPKTKEELEVFEAREGFKLNIAKSMQKLMRHVFYQSDWEGVVRKKVIDDLLTTRYATVVDYYDDRDNQFKCKWKDPCDVVIQHSNEFDFSDATYGGYFERIPIGWLRRKLPDVPLEDIIKLAKKYVGKLGNPKRWEEKYSALDPSTGACGVDSWRIPVFTAYWIDTDIYKSIYWKGKGSERVIDIAYDYKPKPLTKSQIERGFQQEIRKKHVQQVYQCTWVIDSDIAYDWGKFYMGARPKENITKLPIHAERLLGPSLIDQIRPILDRIALVWLQFLNDMANMISRGYAINMYMLMGISMNGKDLDPAAILNMVKRKGILPYMPGPQGTYTGGMPTPITPIEGGLGRRVEETSLALQMLYKSLEDIAGINPLVMGVSPDVKQAVGTSEISSRAVLNIIKPITDSIFEIKQSLAVSLCSRLQIGLRVSEDIRRAYAGVVPPQDIMSMIMAESSGARYGLMLRARPDDNQRASILKYIELAVQQGYLSVSSAMYYTERIIAGDDAITIRQELDYEIKKERERLQSEKLQAIDRQNQGLAAIEQNKAERDARLAQLQGQIDIQEEIIRGQIKKSLSIVENNSKLLDQLREEYLMEKGMLNKIEK